MFTKKSNKGMLLALSLVIAMPMQAAFTFFKGGQTAAPQTTIIPAKTEKTRYATLFSLFGDCSSRTKIIVGAVAVSLIGCAIWLYKRCKKSGDDPKKDDKKSGQSADKPLTLYRNPNQRDNKAAARAARVAYLRKLPSFKKADELGT